METKVGSTRIYRNEGILTIMHAGNLAVFNTGRLKWRKDKEEPAEFTDTWEWYWLQNKYDGSAALFAPVSAAGSASYYNASASSGVRPAFKI